MSPYGIKLKGIITTMLFVKVLEIINKLLHRSSSSPLPTASSDVALAQNFSDFFTSKIAKIQEGLNTGNTPTTSGVCSEPACPSNLDSFNTVSDKDIVKLITSYPIKAWPLDPIPAKLMKHIFRDLAPTIAAAVNSSLKEGIMPQFMKEAMIFPILKKT